MDKRYYDLNTYFRSLYGFRVHKIAVDAGLTCPNRDGSVSTGGCIYCNERGSGTGEFSKGLSISDQLIKGKNAVAKRFKAKKFIAYFQSFSNTYAPLDTLRLLYEEALSVDDIVGLSIGTRPDCIETRVLDLLEGYVNNYLIWIEYGLQSIHDKTLELINRGHDFSSFEKAVSATKNRGIKICTHVVLGLPHENKQHMLETAKAIAGMGIDGVKLHLLYVVKGTRLETLYHQGGFTCLEQGEYVDIVCNFLELLPKEVVIQRLTGDPHPQELVAPMWALEKAKTLDMIKDSLEKRDTFQGKFAGNAQTGKSHIQTL